MVACMYASQEVEIVLECIVVCQGVTVKGIEQVRRVHLEMRYAKTRA